MTVVPEKPSIEEALAHYGVPGMKWGVRRAVAKKADKLKSRDPNKALLREKAMVSTTNAVRYKGFNNAALAKRQQAIARKTRVADGQAKSHEILREFGNLSVINLVRG